MKKWLKHKFLFVNILFSTIKYAIRVKANLYDKNDIKFCCEVVVRAYYINILKKKKQLMFAEQLINVIENSK